MIEQNRYGLDDRYYWRTGENGVAERFPEFCPLGHPLGADTVLISSSPCLCAGRPHRTWRCWVCDGTADASVWVWPACVHHPEWTPWAL
jgi:hypothetical protein